MKRFLIFVLLVTAAVMLSAENKKQLGKETKKGISERAETEFDALQNSTKDDLANAPAWVVNAGYGDPKELCGLGSSKNTSVFSKANAAAAAAGKADMAKKLRKQITSALRKQHISGNIDGASRQISENAAASDTDIKSSWISDNGALYVLVCLGIDQFKNAVLSDEDLDERIKTAVAESAEPIFSELSKAKKSK